MEGGPSLHGVLPESGARRAPSLSLDTFPRVFLNGELWHSGRMKIMIDGIQSSEIIVRMLAVRTKTIIGHYKQIIFIHTEMFSCSLPMPGEGSLCSFPRGFFLPGSSLGAELSVCSQCGGAVLLRALCLRGARGGWGEGGFPSLRWLGEQDGSDRAP